MERKVKLPFRLSEGIPTKSNVLIYQIDAYLKMGFSFLSENRRFDSIILSKIKWAYSSEKRLQSFTFAVGYMLTYDITRMDFLLTSIRFATRSVLISLLKSIESSLKEFSYLVQKKNISEKEALYCFILQSNFRGMSISILRQNLIEVRQKVNFWISYIYQSHIGFLYKCLMAGRRREKDTKQIAYFTFSTLMNAIDRYNPSRSKVPFQRLLSIYAKGIKDELIHAENEEMFSRWRCTISSDDISSEERESDYGLVEHLDNGDDSPFSAIAFSLALPLAIKSLPKPFNRISAMIYLPNLLDTDYDEE